jgi:hypothetical protein
MEMLMLVSISTLIGLRRRAVVPRPTRFRPAPHVRVARGEGRTVLMDVNTSRYWGLDEVGSAIWACIEEGCAPHEMYERLAERYDAPRDQLAADTDTFLARLSAARLVVAT